MSLEVHESSPYLSSYVRFCLHIQYYHLPPVSERCGFLYEQQPGAKVTFQEHPEQVFATEHILFGNSVVFEQEIQSFCPQRGRWLDGCAYKMGNSHMAFPLHLF